MCVLDVWNHSNITWHSKDGGGVGSKQCHQITSGVCGINPSVFWHFPALLWTILSRFELKAIKKHIFCLLNMTRHSGEEKVRASVTKWDHGRGEGA